MLSEKVTPGAALFGDVVERLSILAFDALIAHVMAQPPNCTIRRVSWVVDNGTIHRGARACVRLQARWPNLVLMHLPVHASWLNQIEIYFSILPRKALTPADFASRHALGERILGFQEQHQQVGHP